MAEPTKRIAISKELPTTKLRVYEDRRRRSFRAKVLAVEGEAVVLDQTFFYPEGGGQEADHGTIDEFEVYDVQRTGPTVLHFVRGDASRLHGKRVACAIDANRREALMRNHTATHIVLGAARKVLGNHIWQAGAHKAVDLARLDITHFDALTDAEFAAKWRELAGTLARGATEAFALTKEGLNAAMARGFEEFLEHEADLQDRAGRTHDYAEGVRAFSQKRPAKMEGR